MRKQILLSILTLSSFALNAQWEQQNSGTESNLNSVYFIDNESGWVAGSGGVILHTSDGGETWNQQTSNTDMTLESVHFIDQNRGWIAGGNWSYSIILRTLDGGYNWDIVFMDYGRTLVDICFADSLCGYASGSGIYRTIDGGETWEYIFSEYGGVYDVYFTDSLTGWCVGGWHNGSSGYPYGYIYNTIDGGISWTLQISGNGSDNFGVLYSVCFTDHLSGWAAGGNVQGWPPGMFSNILHTTDGGNNWVFQSSPTEQCLNEIYFTDTSNGWAVGAAGQLDMSVIIHTTDGGENWNQQFCETTDQLNSVYFSDPENGWIAGGNGTILHAENGGLTGIEPYNSANWHTQLQFLSYPNPFSGSVTFEYELNENAIVILEIFNHLGQGVDLLVNEKQSIGIHQKKWNTEALPAGVYLVRLQAGGECVVRKMIVE